MTLLQAVYRMMQCLVYWPNLSLDVKQYVTNCQSCHLCKPDSGKLAGKLQQTEVSRPWELLGIDLIEPSPEELQLTPIPTGLGGILLQLGGALSLKESHSKISLLHCHLGDVHQMGKTRLAYILSD